MNTQIHGFALVNSQSLHEGLKAPEHFQILFLTIQGAPMV